MSEENENPHNLLTLKQASELLNCHPNTLRSWDKKGYLVAVRLGTRGDRRYKKDDVLKLLQKEGKNDKKSKQ